MTASPSDTIRIVLIEDNPEYRRALSLAMEHSTGFELVGKFGTAEQALAEMRAGKLSRNVDMVLLDLGLPRMQGLESIPWIQKFAPEARIVVLTQSDKKADVINAIRMGVAGYLLKSSSMESIREGISEVMEGGASIDPEVAMYLLKQIRSPDAEVTKKVMTPLSKRELEVLDCISKGLARKEIGRKLGIAENTVVSHIRHIYDKLNVPNAPSAISSAYQSGILPIEE
jgi:DNA-binding NarL/FixJ family response regulator